MSLLFPRFVDSAVPLTKAQRKIARGRAWSKWRQNKWNLAIYFAIFGSLIAVSGLVVLSLNKVINSVIPSFGYAGLLVAYWSMVWLIYRLLQHFWFAPHYRRAVRDLGIDVCVGCGYWLRGLDEQVNKCPECGLLRSAIATSGRDPLLWDAEARRALAEVGFEPCGECGVLCKVQMKQCPVCGAKRDAKTELE